MEKFINRSGVYTIVLPHYIDMQHFRMGRFNNLIEYIHIEYKNKDNIEYSEDDQMATVILTMDYKDWESYIDYLKLVEYINILSAKVRRLIIIAQLPEASTYNLLQAGMELLDDDSLIRIHPRSFSIPKSVYNMSDAVISIDNIKWPETDEGRISYYKIRVLKSPFFEFGKELNQSQII